MSLWNAPASVGNNEYIGRRLFDEPRLEGTADQPRFERLALTHFEETRDNKWSIDRLGNGAVANPVKRYLHPRAEQNGNSFKKPKRFDGWATIRIGTICLQTIGTGAARSNLSVSASPIPGDENDLKSNRYHAHIVKPDDIDPEHMALRSRHFFEGLGKVEPINPTKPTSTES